MPRTASIAAILTLLAATVAACAAPPPARRDVVLGIVGEPSSVFADEPGARILEAAVTETLVRRDAREEFTPRLAAVVPTIENGGAAVVADHDEGSASQLVATFQLRRGLRWQDGTPLTASDVQFAWQHDRALPPGTEARYAADRVERVDVLDDDLARFWFLPGERWDDYPLAARALPRHILAGADAKRLAAFDHEPVHAGPFSVAAWLPGYGATLAAFPDYFGGKPALGRIEVRFLASSAAAIAALRAGEVDIVPSPGFEADIARTLDRFADGTTLQTYYTAAEGLDVLRFSHDPQRFGDPLVRRAVELAVDRQQIVDSVFAGRARVPTSYLVPPLWAAADRGPPGRADRAAARALLAQAGFAPGNFGILERGGQRMVTTLLVAADSSARVGAAQLVAGDLAAIGIAASVRARPGAEVAAAVARGDYELALVPQDASDPQEATEAYSGVAGPWFEIFSAAARGATDRSQKRTFYGELQRMWAEDLPGLPLYQWLSVDVAPTALVGVQPAPSGAPITWNAGTWRFER